MYFILLFQVHMHLHTSRVTYFHHCLNIAYGCEQFSVLRRVHTEVNLFPIFLYEIVSLYTIVIMYTNIPLVTAVYVVTGKHTLIPVIILVALQIPVHVGFWFTCRHMAHGKTADTGKDATEKIIRLPVGGKDEGEKNEEMDGNEVVETPLPPAVSVMYVSCL